MTRAGTSAWQVAGIFRQYTTLTKPVPLTPTWQPPITPTMRGLHGSAGGCDPHTRPRPRSDLIRRNAIKFMLIAAYEPNQQHIIGQLRSAGVETVHHSDVRAWPRQS